MSQQAKQFVQKSLCEVDRLRKRQTLAFLLLFGCLVACLTKLGYMSESTAGDLKQMLLWSVLTIVLAIVYGTMALAIYINKSTTKKILKAMEALNES